MTTELKPWYAVAIPHEDIQKGRLSEAVFAANLWAVVQGTAPKIYTDAETFFDKTYLTVGLTKVLKKVASALSGDADAGDRILSLQTAFGGGKTHALVALWHLANNPTGRMNEYDVSHDTRYLSYLGSPVEHTPSTVAQPQTPNTLWSLKNNRIS